MKHTKKTREQPTGDQQMPDNVQENCQLFSYQYYFLAEHFSNILST
jgi:hypothetical protein